MDNLVLTSVALALDSALRGARLVGFRQQRADRFGILWEREERNLATAISMRPQSPWIGRPAVRVSSKNLPQSPFAARVRRALSGQVLLAVIKPSSDRWIEFQFAGQQRLIVELAAHGANILLLDAAGKVETGLRCPPSARERLAVGSCWSPPVPPPALLDPWDAGAARIDARLAAALEEGDELVVALRRRLFGVGAAAAALVVDEARATGRTHGELLAGRLAGLTAGRDQPVIEISGEPIDSAASTLWPWRPEREPLAGSELWSGADAAETAGRWYDTVDLARVDGERQQSLLRIVERELARSTQLRQRVQGDLARFEDPARFKRWAEAILAGLSRAVRRGAAVQVPDPADECGPQLVIPAQAGLPLPKVADLLFVRHRRALRALGQIEERMQALEEKLSALAELERLAADPATQEQELVERMRALRLPVALEPSTRAGREAAVRRRPRLEGVRVYYATSGEMILAGKGAKENHRLTFQLAAAHDFWFHASGVPGAHVVLRNESRAAQPGPALLEAAAVAAFHSESAREGWADVQWTLRKNVKKPRGAAKGVVVLKRFEVVRVRPGLPGETPKNSG